MQATIPTCGAALKFRVRSQDRNGGTPLVDGTLC